MIASQEPSRGASARRRQIAAAVRQVADHMGNTPAVCRASYIDPRVFDRFREGRTIAGALEGLDPDDDDDRQALEAAVLDLLADGDQVGLAA